MGEYVQVSTTTEKREDAEIVAKALVEKRLAGCVQILGPIVSTYRWKGKLETAEEWLCVIKTRADRYRELEKVLKETHPYQTPEIIVTPIVAGSEDYLKWLDNELR